MLTLRCTCLEQTARVGEAVGRALRPADVVRLFGDLGAGKTTFVRAIARGMGMNEHDVNSPTYTIANEYTSGGRLMVHIDAYRVDDPDETLEQIALAAALRDGGVVCVEWPERLEGALPESALDVRLIHSGEEAREIVLSGALADEHRDLWLGLLPETGGPA